MMHPRVHRSIPNMLVNRLVLNLRTYDSEESFVRPHLSTMIFSNISTESQSRVLGNIGAQLDHEQWSHGPGEFVDEPSDFGAHLQGTQSAVVDLEKVGE